MGAHVIKSEDAPVDAPTEEQLGVHWLKTVDPVGHWLAVDTTVDGWLDLLNLPTGGGTTYTSVPVPIASATTYLQRSSSIGTTGDGDTWESIDRVNISAVGPASYDPDGIVDHVNQVFIVPAGATHFTVDYMMNVNFESDATGLLVEFSFKHQPMPWVATPGGLVIDHVQPMTSVDNSFAYVTMCGSSPKTPCTPGYGIAANLYWEGPTGAANDLGSLSESAVTITFYAAP